MEMYLLKMAQALTIRSSRSADLSSDAPYSVTSSQNMKFANKYLSACLKNDNVYVNKDTTDNSLNFQDLQSGISLFADTDTAKNLFKYVISSNPACLHKSRH